MGKTPKPLFIVITDPNVYRWAEIEALMLQGHEIRPVTDFVDCTKADLILGPTCWLMDEQHRNYLDLAITEARRRRYPPTKKESA